MKKICVIGSLNIDLTASVPRFNVLGETIFGTDFQTFTGGKGGNQAVAAAKLGADVCMLGKLGNDANGGIWRQLMQDLKITDRVETAEGHPSGVALIEVDPKGENRIIVISGANMQVDRDQIDRNWDALMAYDIFLFQLEIPLETVLYAAKRLHEAGKTVILDPAPAAPLPDELISNVDYITPNETELATLCSCSTEDIDEVKAAAGTLLARGCGNVIAKMGGRGAMLVNPEGAVLVPGFKVNAVDTTAAGDSFNAGLAVALADGLSGADAIRFANAVGAISTTAVGAQGAMPSREQVDALLK